MAFGYSVDDMFMLPVRLIPCVMMSKPDQVFRLSVLCRLQRIIFGMPNEYGYTEFIDNQLYAFLPLPHHHLRPKFSLQYMMRSFLGDLFLQDILPCACYLNDY